MGLHGEGITWGGLHPCRRVGVNASGDFADGQLLEDIERLRKLDARPGRRGFEHLHG